MNPLIEVFPTALIIAGGEYAIHSGFRTVLKINAIVGDKKELSPEELEEMLQLFYPVIPEDLNEAICQMMEFLECGRKAKDKAFPKKAAGLNGKQGMDLMEDAEEIYSAFYQQYGIDLQEDMHWWKFNILLGNLSSDTRLAKIVEYRTIDTANKNLSKEERNYYKAMQRYYALENRAVEPDDREKAIEEALMNGGDVGALLEGDCNYKD